MIDILDEVFPRVAEAYRRAGITAPKARIGVVIDEYDEPDAVIDEICKLTDSFDLKLDFDNRADLARFRQAYEAVVKSSTTA
jgi:hypothetical protein